MPGICFSLSFFLPANDATDVSVDTLIALRFSRLLAPRTVNDETIVLNSSAGRSYAKVVATENGRQVFVSPLEPLEPNTSYTLTLNGANDGVNEVVPASITFTTAQDSQDKQPDQSNQPDWVPAQMRCVAIGPARTRDLPGRTCRGSKRKPASPHCQAKRLRCAVSRSPT